MASDLVAWDRLVRYVPKGGTEIRYGEPILQSGHLGEIAELARNGQLHVTVLKGDDPLEARPTEETEIVGTLLGPLKPRNVPIVRCIGLNYKTHSMKRSPLSPAVKLPLIAHST
jgi:hypothetical protein